MRARHEERGFAMMMAILVVVVVAGISTALVSASATHHAQSMLTADRARALALAEGAATLLLAELSDDPVGPVKNVLSYDLDGATFRRVYTPFAAGDGQARVEITYFYNNSGVLTPRIFADRLDPTELYVRVRARVTGIRARTQRTIEIDFDQRFNLFDDAIASDAIPISDSGNGKSLAMEGHIVFDDKGRPGQFYVAGSMSANGGVYYDDTDAPLVTETANDYINFAGEIDADLGGTGAEIPDFTAPGSSDQLFDFDRVIAAARAGAGREFTTKADYVAAQNAANALGVPLEGITVLSIGAGWGNDKLDIADMPGGVNIRGTLVFNFAPGTPANEKIWVTLPFNVNKADLTFVVPSDPNTYTTGYDTPYLDPSKKPSAVDISGLGFENFTDDDDLPALMFNTGIVDQHGASNICGLIYGPSFVELENKAGQVQYFNGSILGGAGVLVEGHDSTGYTIIAFDPNTIDRLATAAGAGKGLRILSWRTVQ
jgi:hypothetical protein